MRRPSPPAGLHTQILVRVMRNETDTQQRWIHSSLFDGISEKVNIEAVAIERSPAGGLQARRSGEIRQNDPHSHRGRDGKARSSS
jgi:hypothetical protein